jgi:Uma2 family endonuclease
MEVKKRLSTVDDVLELQGWDGTRDRKYELINGELIEMSPANLLHAWLASKIDRTMGYFADENDLGFSFVEGGFSPPDDRYNLLGPDVAFVSKARMPEPIPQTFAGFMPDLAVEIASPSNTVAELRRKALIYLNNGTRLVWILFPERNSAEVCRLDEENQLEIEAVGINGKLDGEDVLPEFELELRRLFNR